MSEMKPLADKNTKVAILNVSYIQQSRGKQEHNLVRKGRDTKVPCRMSGDQKTPNLKRKIHQVDIKDSTVIISQCIILTIKYKSLDHLCS